jgi:site-specific DNA-methyltransferase (adenine-specific)
MTCRDHGPGGVPRQQRCPLHSSLRSSRVGRFPAGDMTLSPTRPFNARATRNRDAKKEEQTMQNTEQQAIYNPSGTAARHQCGPELSTNRIIHGDCIQILSGLDSGSIDFVLTDPPYITHYKSRDGRTVMNDDNAAWLAPAFSELYRVLRRDSFCVSFYGWNQVDKFISAWRKAGFRIVGHMVFTKRYASSQRYLRYQHEQAYLLAKGTPQLPHEPVSDVLPWTYTHNRLHPTQKPVSVLKPLIEAFSGEGELVLDPFCGSASTLVAAHQLGRQYLGIELDPEYFRIASQRLCDMTAP